MSLEITPGLHPTKLFQPVIQLPVPTGWSGEELDPTALVLWPPEKTSEVAIDSTDRGADPEALARAILETPGVDLEHDSPAEGTIRMSGVASEEVTFNDNSGRLSLDGYMNEIYVLRVNGDTITVWLLGPEQDWQRFRADADPLVRSLLATT